MRSATRTSQKDCHGQLQKSASLGDIDLTGGGRRRPPPWPSGATFVAWSLAQPVDELVADRVLDLLTTRSCGESLVRGSGRCDDGAVAGALAELGSGQSRLQMLDDDYYLRGVLPLRRYRSIRVGLAREVERLHALVDGASRQRIVLHPDPRRLWSGADFGQRRELVHLIVERVNVMQASSEHLACQT